MASTKSPSFWYAIVIWIIQCTTILLTLIDLCDTRGIHVNNPLRIPPMVDLTVSIGQGIAIFMILPYHSDFIEGVLKLQDGFYPEIMEQGHPGATYNTWLFSCLAQLFAGILLLITSFVLTMQTTNVVSIMLNFAALLFIQEIDDVGFAMAKMGFIRTQLQKDVESVLDIQVPKRKSRNRKRRILYLLILFMLIMGYTTLKTRQWTGMYLQTHVYVQFGDSYNPKLPYFSGILSSGNVHTVKHREYRDMATGKTLLGYCYNKGAWTFSETNDSCNYFAISKRTPSYDVTTIADEAWQVVDTHGRLQPFDSFSLAKRDCNPATCQGECGGDHGDDDDDGFCRCPHDRFGMDCEFSNVCPTIALDATAESFPSGTLDHPFFAEKVAVSSEYEILTNQETGEYVKIYNMPVYYSNKTYPANIIFFAGRRWILTSEWDLCDLRKERKIDPTRTYFKQKTVATLERDFHGFHQASYTPFFMSDPVDFETPKFQPTPIGVKWWTVKEVKKRQFVPDKPLDAKTIMACSTCHSSQGTFCDAVGGSCNPTTGICECEEGYFGDNCSLQKACYEQDLPCNGRGECDAFSGLCRCNLPHYGDQCQNSFKCYEEDGACKNGGVCDLETGECACPEDPAIGGLSCEQSLHCDIFGCGNGGYCGPNGACICRRPFHGLLCDLVDSSWEEYFCSTDDDCSNGTCDTTTGICSCNDPTSFGTRCEHTYDCRLEWHNCSNGGRCMDDSGLCECPDPYFGPDCSQVPPCLDDSDCGDAPHDTCDIRTGKCNCLVHSGKRCEVTSYCHSDEDCNHGGFCEQFTCHCQPGFAGDLCELRVDGMYDPQYDLMQLQQEEAIRRCGFEDPNC